ncbi:ABC transporter substrate-binding protein [Prauserella cavernicola]|uniref:Carbohydrate ABC transporter substrate-binding protein n=1 Tax=Prauserella cavernicola TaxID=2800127 RepID=A0A934V329_9PSEU|nr:ABC transporter substrate-binding protein [Prauserella cavernicola]MBK1783837.1 carbohydrate ABC transporter substrate-binding protein [Prauserella cavernicola]
MMSTHRGRTVRGGAAVAAALSLVLLPACAAGGSSESSDGEIRMMVNLTDNLDQAYWEKLVKPFEDESGLKVKIEGPTGKSVAESFPQQLAAGTAPEVIQSIFPDDDTAPELVDLSDEAWAKDTPMFDDYAMEGAHYAVGVGTQTQSLIYYNKTAFTEAGIAEPPKTWAELDDALGKLKQAGFTPMQTAGDFQTGLQLQQIYHPTLNQEHPKWQAKVAEGELNVGDIYEPAFQLYADWISEGHIAKSDVGLSPSQADGNFIAGKVGLYTNGSWFAATLAQAEDLPFEVGVFSPPTEDGSAYPGPQGATMANPYMIRQGGGDEDGAKQLVEFLVTDPAAIEAQLGSDGVFRQGADVEQSDVEAQIQTILDDAPELVAVGEGQGDVRLPVTGFNPKLTEIAQSLYTGASPADAARAIDQWIGSSS